MTKRALPTSEEMIDELLLFGIFMRMAIAKGAIEMLQPSPPPPPKPHKPTPKQLATQKRRRRLTADVMEALRKQEDK